MQQIRQTFMPIKANPRFRFPVLLAGICSVLCFLDACAIPAPENHPPPPQPVTTLANPASQNCVRQGGKLLIQKHGDGGEYGICVFEDNRQCEEWAMMRGACPTGGIKITGYLTPAAQYCAVTGGQYSISGTEGPIEQEQGTCSLAGKTCDVWAYYNGLCRLND
jgi:putative hemolysin